MKTTKTENELRGQYSRIVQMWNNAYKDAQDKQDGERCAILDARGAKIDKLYARMRKIAELVAMFKSYPDCMEYVSAKGNKCFRTLGRWKWFALICAEAGVSYTWDGDFSATAIGNGFELSYCEGDITLAIIK